MEPSVALKPHEADSTGDIRWSRRSHKCLADGTYNRSSTSRVSDILAPVQPSRSPSA